MVNCVIFAICYFQLHKKSCLQNFCLIKKWMMLEIVKKNVFRFMILPNNMVLICKIVIILCFIHSILIMKYVFFAKIWFMKTLTRIVNINHELINQTLLLFLQYLFLKSYSHLYHNHYQPFYKY